MIKRRWFDFLNSIAGQLLVLLVLAMVLFLTGIYISVQAARDVPLAPPVMLFSERQIGVAEALSRLPENELLLAIKELEASHPKVSYKVYSSDQVAGLGLEWTWRNHFLKETSKPFRDSYFDRITRFLRPYSASPPKPGVPDWLSNPQEVGLPFAREVEKLQNDQMKVTIFARRPDDKVISASIVISSNSPPNHALENIFVFTLVCMSLLLLWAIIFLIRPLRRLAQATNNIAKENATPKKAEVAGPTELRVAATALNKMQDRIHQLIDDRTRMLAAVGHDLRTPVTRLRLRADTVEPEELKLAFLRDLTMMDGLLKRLMTYFSKGDMEEEPVRLELSSLVDSLANEWSDAGEAVELVDYTNVTILAKPNDLMRMVDNLIDNAIKYAGSCELSLTKEADFACLKVIDHGPGIAQEDKLHLLEPFARGDKARTMNDKSGFGLGLAIARRAAQSHNATLELGDTEGGGLTIVVRFPLSA